VTYASLFDKGITSPVACSVVAAYFYCGNGAQSSMANCNLAVSDLRSSDKEKVADAVSVIRETINDVGVDMHNNAILRRIGGSSCGPICASHITARPTIDAVDACPCLDMIEMTFLRVELVLLPVSLGSMLLSLRSGSSTTVSFPRKPFQKLLMRLKTKVTWIIGGALLMDFLFR